MARYSPIGPIAILEALHEAQVLGNYLLLLPHDVLQWPSRYEDLMSDIRANEPEYADGEDKLFIIMDNSVVELGEPVDLDHVIDAADIVDASCIVTPDALGSKGETIRLLEMHKDKLASTQYPLMRIPQGGTMEELVECTRWLRDMLPARGGEPEYWGVPRWVANTFGSRIPLVQFINMSAKEKPREIKNPMIHLLGMSSHYMDDLRCSHLPNVIGIDSANPVVMGQHHMDMTHIQWEHMTRGDYWDDKVVTREAILNVELMHEQVR